MAAKCICPSCDQVVNGKHHALECTQCLCWLHKGCTGLSSSEFNSVCDQFERTRVHDWVCSSCSGSKVRRASMGPGSDHDPASGQSATSDRISTRSGRNNRSSNSSGLDGSLVNEATNTIYHYK